MDPPLDRLSSLPDVILGDILSLLSTETAVFTSVLSNRWRYLWTQLTSLRLNFHHCPLQNSEFDTVTDQLLTRLTSNFLSDFTLRAPFQTHLLHLESLLRHFCSRRVQNIEIFVPDSCYSTRSTFTTASSCIFQTQTLVSLQLIPFIPTYNYFSENNTHVIINLPNLRLLWLGFTPSHFGFALKLVRSCPSLEALYLTVTSDTDDDDDDDDNANANTNAVIDISCPNLKHLDLKVFSAPDNQKLVIDAPKLNCFHLAAYTLASCTFVNKRSALHEALIFLSNQTQYLVLSPLLHVLSNVTLLHIPGRSFGLFARSKEAFNNLTKLRLSFEGNGDGELHDVSFASSSPSLLLRVKTITIAIEAVQPGNIFNKLSGYLLSNAPDLEKLTFLIDHLRQSEDTENYTDEEILGIDLDLMSKNFPRCQIKISE